MVGLAIQKRIRWTWVKLGTAAWVGAVLGGIFLGPSWIFVFSGLGLVFSFVAILLSLNVPDRYASVGYGVAIGAIHVLLFLIGWVLVILFLRPLNAASHQMPALRYVYRDPDGRFTLLGPEGWDYEIAPSGNDIGLRIRPLAQRDYVGVSELRLVIHRLDQAPASVDRFLQQMAGDSPGRAREIRKKYFDFEVRPMTLSDGEKAVLSILDIRRLWIPVRQTNLFTLKSGVYLCSASATGLKNHSLYSAALCASLLEGLRLPPSRLKRALPASRK